MAASWSGQPRAILSTPSAATAVSASMEPEWPASQIGPCTSTRRKHGRASSKVSRVQSFTTGRSACQAVGSPVTLPTMKPTSGHPIRQVKPRSTV